MLYVFQQFLKQSELEYEQVLSSLRSDLTHAGITYSNSDINLRRFALRSHLSAYSELHKVGTLGCSHETGLDKYLPTGIVKPHTKCIQIGPRDKALEIGSLAHARRTSSCYLY